MLSESTSMSERTYPTWYELNNSVHQHTLRRTFSLLTTYSRNSVYAFQSLPRDLIRRRESFYSKKNTDITSLEVKYVDEPSGICSDLRRDTTQSFSNVTIITSTKLCNTSNQSIAAYKGSFIPTKKAPSPPLTKSSVLDNVEKSLRKISEENKTATKKRRYSVKLSTSTVINGLRRLSLSASFIKRNAQTSKFRHIKEVQSSNNLKSPSNFEQLSVDEFSYIELDSTNENSCYLKPMTLNDSKSPLQFLIPGNENTTSALPQLDKIDPIGKILTTSGEDDIAGALIYLLDNDSISPI